MTEFEKTLQEYRKLVEQVADESGFLDFLKAQLAEVEQKLKEMAKTSQVALVYTVQSPITAVAPNDSLPALQEAAKAVEYLGDGVNAPQLAKHLNISRDAARLRLQRAARVGLIARMGTGRYRAIKQAPTEARGAIGSNGIAHFEKADGPED